MLHALNDKENYMDFYDMIFPIEAKMYKRCMHLRTPYEKLEMKI